MVATQVGVELEPLKRHGESGTYQAGYDTETTSASMAVVAAIVEATDTEPTDVEPLQETIETDALNEVLRPREITRGAVQVSFVYEGRAVTVTSDGVVTVAPPGESANPVPTEAKVSQ